MKRYLLGIDIGTSGAKALLINNEGVVEAEATAEYPMSTPKPLWAEQDPEDWWSGSVSSIKKVLEECGAKPEQIVSLGLTGQMHGLVLLDKQGKVIRPCIMWNDQRSAQQCADMTREIGKQRILELTGNPLLPGFTAPKIIWVRETEPKAYKRIAKILLPKDYVRYRLSGEILSEVSDASGTSLFNVAGRSWSDEMLKHLNIPREWLPDVTESIEVSSAISADAARKTGLLEGTPVVGGAGDQAAQSVGTGIITDGVCSITIGTSGVVFVACNEYLREPEGRLHAFCHAVPGMWHLMGVMLSAGGSFRWYRDALGGKDPYDILTEAAAQIPAGCEGMIFLPYLSGERTPYPDPTARGVFFGLTLRHTKAHMTRSVMEGVTFGLRDSLELIRGLGRRIGEIRVSGGGANSSLWRQIMADIFSQEVFGVNATQGAAYGAALLAGVGAGVFGSVREACHKAIKKINNTKPDQDVPIYEEYYRRYRSLYPVLKEDFAEISELTTKYHNR
jgi:xylulokinase